MTINEKKFKVGDRVIAIDCDKLGVVKSLDIEGYGCVVLFDDLEEAWLECELLQKSDEPIYDLRKAFLIELKSLMEKYNADIQVSGRHDNKSRLSLVLSVHGNKTVIHEMYGICPNNIDYIVDFL